MDLTQEKIYSQLKSCMDPELPVNIVDLGLIYGVEISAEREVKIKMTLTTRGCCMGNRIQEDVEKTVRKLPEVRKVNIEIIWDPPWDQHLISEEGRKKLGMV